MLKLRLCNFKNMKLYLNYIVISITLYCERMNINANFIYWRYRRKSRRNTIAEYLPKLKQAYKPTLSIVNAENAAHGKGLTENYIKQLLRDGVDFMTMGNHTYGQREIYDFIDDAKRMIRPANFSE